MAGAEKAAEQACPEQGQLQSLRFVNAPHLLACAATRRQAPVRPARTPGALTTQPATPGTLSTQPADAKVIQLQPGRKTHGAD
jgi:hypothetical protein